METVKVVGGVCLVTCLGSAVAAPAATINVPADQPTIQAGIDAAVSGVDEVVVAPGTYNEVINFNGKAITVRSSGGAGVTTIDGTGLSDSVVKCVSGEGPNTVLQGFTITGGQGTDDGGGVRIGGGMLNINSSPTVSNCIFSGNWPVDGLGGGMANDASSPVVTDCTFTQNRVDNGMWWGIPNSKGGGMYNRNGSNPALTNCTFAWNSAVGGKGGGIYTEAGAPMLIDCTFSFNSVGESKGGGMHNLDSSAILTNCTFTTNDGAFGGGGIYNNNSNVVVTDCTFTGNIAAYAWGGGMWNVGSNAVVSNCTFRNNIVGVGGAFESGGGMANTNSSPIVADCTFTGNEGFGAGGMYNAASSPTVTGCTFTGNRARLIGGGGMRNIDGSSPTVINCTFTGNVADEGGSTMGGGGAGMDNDNSSSPTVVNCTFTGNMADNFGGAMRNTTNSNPTIINCTFTHNLAADHYGQLDGGGGIYNAGSYPVVTNCILWANADVGGTDESAQIHDDTTSASVVTYTDLQGGWTGAGGTGNIDADPLFVRNPDPGPDGTWDGVDDDYGDLRLQGASGCIDAGDNDSVPADVADLDGDGDTAEPTPYDLASYVRFANRVATPDTGNAGAAGPPVVDMGAYEHAWTGDFDLDGDADVHDFLTFSNCFNGPMNPPQPACQNAYADIDGDGDVDVDDFLTFANCFNGALNPPGCP